MVLENLVAEKVFDGESLEPLLNKLKEDVSTLVPDVDTAKGRKEIASIAAKISKSKVYLDGLGKDMVSDMKNKCKVIDNQRKFAREFLDEVKTEFRAPLTEWENAEKTRIATHEKNIFDIKEKGQFCHSQWREVPVETLENHLKTVESIDVTIFEEFEHDATTAKFLSIDSINKAITKRLEYDAEQKELADLRAQAAEAEAKKREEQIKADALAKAQAELDKKRQQLEEEKADADRRAAEAEDKAFKELEAKQAAEKAEREAREADTAHRGKINREAAAALVSIGMNKDEARTVITAIARKMIPNVSVNY